MQSTALEKGGFTGPLSTWPKALPRPSGQCRNAAPQAASAPGSVKWLYRLGKLFPAQREIAFGSPPGHDRILAHAHRDRAKSQLKAPDMVLVDMEGRRVGESRNVTSEIGMHLAIYHQRPDVQAVVHAHPPIATGSFASCGLALEEPLCSEIVMSLRLQFPLAPYATTGTADVASSIQPLIVDHDAILLANHGVVTAGDTLQNAFMRMETVEHFAHICLDARQLGSPQLLSCDRLQQLAEARSRYQRNAAPGC